MQAAYFMQPPTSFRVPGKKVPEDLGASRRGRCETVSPPTQGRENAVEIPSRSCSHNSIQLYSHTCLARNFSDETTIALRSSLNFNLSIYTYIYKIYLTNVYRVKKEVVAPLAKLSYFFLWGRAVSSGKCAI